MSLILRWLHFHWFYVRNKEFFSEKSCWALWFKVVPLIFKNLTQNHVCKNQSITCNVSSTKNLATSGSIINFVAYLKVVCLYQYKRLLTYTLTYILNYPLVMEPNWLGHYLYYFPVGILILCFNLIACVDSKVSGDSSLSTLWNMNVHRDLYAKSSFS